LQLFAFNLVFIENEFFKHVVSVPKISESPLLMAENKSSGTTGHSRSIRPDLLKYGSGLQPGMGAARAKKSLLKNAGPLTLSQRPGSRFRENALTPKIVQF
jgi:hypothetical protein